MLARSGIRITRDGKSAPKFSVWGLERPRCRRSGDAWHDIENIEISTPRAVEYRHFAHDLRRPFACHFPRSRRRRHSNGSIRADMKGRSQRRHNKHTSTVSLSTSDWETDRFRSSGGSAELSTVSIECHVGPGVGRETRSPRAKRESISDRRRIWWKVVRGNKGGVFDV